MTRLALARASGVSLRFVLQIEGGRANPSLRILFRLAEALALPIAALVTGPAERPIDQILISNLLDRLTKVQLAEVHGLLSRRYGANTTVTRGAIALIGLRGAGKTTLGARLAKHLRTEFVELDRVLERRLGASIGEVIQFYGQAGYRKYQREALSEVLDSNQSCVIEPGGGMAADTEALDLILGRTRAIWLKASPDDHMRRVMDQGDFRPMAGSRAAKRDLRSILKAREPYYSLAPLQLQTSGRTVSESLQDLIALVRKDLNWDWTAS